MSELVWREGQWGAVGQGGCGLGCLVGGGPLQGGRRGGGEGVTWSARSWAQRNREQLAPPPPPSHAGPALPPGRCGALGAAAGGALVRRRHQVPHPGLRCGGGWALLLAILLLEPPSPLGFCRRSGSRPRWQRSPMFVGARPAGSACKASCFLCRSQGVQHS